MTSATACAGMLRSRAISVSDRPQAWPSMMRGTYSSISSFRHGREISPGPRGIVGGDGTAARTALAIVGLLLVGYSLGIA